MISFSFVSYFWGSYLKKSCSSFTSNSFLTFSTTPRGLKTFFRVFQNLLMIILQPAILQQQMQRGKEFNDSRIRRRPSSRIADNVEDMPSQDLQRKIVELESSMTTLRTNMQLKFSKLSDPNIELRSQLDKEMNNHRHLDLRISQLQNSIASMRESNKSSSEVDYATMSEMQNKIMVLQYKIKTTEKSPFPLALPSIQPEITDSRQNREIRVLKDIVNQEIKMREKREEFLNKQYEQLFQKMIKVERMSYEQKEFVPPEPTKQSNSAEINYVKDTVESIANRMSSEAIAREKKEHYVKQYIESMISGLREELLNENKSIIESQIDTTREINESLQALYGTISDTKQGMHKDLETTQSLISQNVKILSKRIENIKDKMSRPGSSQPVSQPSEDLRSKIVHSIQMIEQRIVDIESSKKGANSESEKRTNSMFNELSTNVDEFQESLNTWTKEVETKNISIFKEISSNLKNMKLELSSAKQELQAKLLQTEKTTTSLGEDIAKLKEQVPQLKAQIKEQSVKHASQIRQVRDFVDSGKMQLQKLITESLRDMDNRNMKHNHYVNQKLVELNSKFQESLFEEVQKLTKKISKEISHLGEVISQRDKRINNEITIISEALKYNQIRTQGQISDLQEKSMESYLKLKTDLVELQTHEAKLREKQSERVEVSFKTLSQSWTKRIDFVSEGTKKALELAMIKDKTELVQLIEKNRDICMKSIGTLKYDFTNDIYIRIEDERADREKGYAYLQSMTQMLRDDLDSKLDRYDKQLMKIESLQILTNKRDTEVKAAFKGVQQNMKILQQQSIYMKQEVGKFGGDVQIVTDQVYKIDEKMTRQIQEGMEKLSNQLSVDNMFVKTQFEEHNKTIGQLIKITSDLVENGGDDPENENEFR